MVRCCRYLLAICATLLAAPNPHLAAAKRSRGLEIDVVNSDEYAESVVAIQANQGPSLGISGPDHAQIASILSSTREIIKTADLLAESGGDHHEVKAMLALANSVFAEVKDHIHDINVALHHRKKEENGQMDLMKTMLTAKYSDHDVEKAREDDERSLDVTRNMYETMINFPECLERLFQDCIGIINRELRSLGLRIIEFEVREKRRPDDEGYNDVVIVTNELADLVLGRAGDGIVSYPYSWNDVVDGVKTVGLDGKWNCLNLTPEACCETITKSVPNPDVQGRYLGCHIFVPFGGIGNPKRSDRVIINLSPDGRVQEAPIIH